MKIARLGPERGPSTRKGEGEAEPGEEESAEAAGGPRVLRYSVSPAASRATLREVLAARLLTFPSSNQYAA